MSFGVIASSLTNIDVSLAPQLAGALALGSTNYTIPSSTVLYVSPSGNDANPGTIDAPKRSLIAASQALKGSTSSSNLGTIVLRGGVYHEGEYQPGNGAYLRWQAYPGEEVWLDGSSVLSGWTAVGDGTWTASYDAPEIPALGNDVLEGDANAILPDMCWLDGAQLFQIADGATPASGQFSVDRSANTLRIATNPASKEVRISDLIYVHLSGSRIDLLGIGVRRYRCAGSPSLHLGLYYGGTSENTLIENCFFIDMGRNVITTTKNGSKIRQCTFQNIWQNAILGGGSTSASMTGYVLEQCVIRGCNRGRWKNQPTSGAVKLTRMNRPIVRHNIIIDADRGGLIWTDVACIEPIVYGNYLDGTSYYSGTYAPSGICLEESDGGAASTLGLAVANTIVNCKAGVVVSATGRTLTGWNSIASVTGSAQGICVLQDRDAHPGGEAPTRAAYPRWSIGNSIYSNWIQPQEAGWQLLIYDSHGMMTDSSNPNRPNAMELFGYNVLGGGRMLGAPWSAPYVAGNCFAPATGSSSNGSIMATIGRQLPNNTTSGSRVNVNTPTAMADYNGSSDISAAAGAFGDNMQGTSPNHAAAYPMPSVVADLLGLTTGMLHIGNPLPDPVER